MEAVPDMGIAALRALASDYGHINWSLFGEALNPPPLSLTDSGTTLGTWHSHPRGIAMSRQLVLERGWGEVLEVLKHEMAHQYVDEVLGIRDQTAHGPAFRRVCSERGIDARASGAAAPTAAASGVMQRVQKLLALAESPNPHEAEAAMHAAHRLMLKHNLEHIGGAPDAQHDNYGYRHLGKPTGRSTEAERTLAGLLGEFFFVQPIWVSVFRVADGKRVNVLEITGRHENLAMAEYVYAFLLHASDALWKQHKREHGIRRDQNRQAYRAGVIRGFADKLRRERKRQAGSGLVWLGDAQAERHFKRRHPRVQTTRTRSTERADAANQGREAGRKLHLSRPLEQGSKARGRLLTSG